MRILAVTCLAACSVPEPVVDTGLTLCEAAALEGLDCEVGGGTVVIESLGHAEELPFVQGPQGGFHVFGSFRAYGVHPGEWGGAIGPETPIVNFLVLENEEMLGGYQGLHRPLKTRTDGTKELVGEILVLGVGTRDEAANRTVDLLVELVDTCGNTISDRREDLVLVPSG